MRSDSSAAPLSEEKTAPVQVRYSNRRAVLALISRERAGTMLFVPCAEAVPVGRRQVLKVSFADCNKNFYLRGLVHSARDNGAQRVGFNYLIQGPADERAFAHLFAFCSRQQEPAKRFPAAIPCTLETPGESAPGKIRDLSTTGAFIVARSPKLREGVTLKVAVKGGFLGLSKKELEARIVWAGEKNGREGFGAEFLSSANQVLELLRRHAIGAR